MKKFRGKRRYFRNLFRGVELEPTKLQFDDDAWFDLWHSHLDFNGYGNSSLSMRRQHIIAHIALYRKILRKLETFKNPYQSWILIDDQDACRDAVFIHTPNPNEDNFPLKIENLKWNASIPIDFKNFINTNDFVIGHYETQTEGGYIIQSKTQGTKLITYYSNQCVSHKGLKGNF
ncbi:hypothetical protein [Bacillus sp. EB01]|uniref:hypothetical protein n=1 Tax=Bacillus sp. EB01 TaxID=1347086 RepID=UPI0005C623D1|nr:hypothetical protein [Bacillus sp. EB01]